MAVDVLGEKRDLEHGCRLDERVDLELLPLPPAADHTGGTVSGRASDAALLQ